VDHAVAGEPVVGRRVGGPDGVGPVAQEAAVEVGGDGAGDGQVGGACGRRSSRHDSPSESIG
jgi:hypothetical protein